MYQVRQVANLALNRIGAINFGEAPDQTTAQVVLDTMKMMIDEWSIKYSNFQNYIVSATAKNVMTIGTDLSNPLVPVYGDIAERPSTIEEVFAVVGNVNFPLQIKPYSEWNKIPVQNVNAIPTEVFTNYSYPYITLYFFPGFGTNSIVKIVGKSYMLDENLTLNSYIDFPREWLAGIVSNLALRIAPIFGVAADQSLIIQAASDIKHIKQLNFAQSIGTLENDLTSNRGFNLLAGR